MSEKRGAGPTGGRAEAKTTLARATAHTVKGNGYGDEHLTYGINHTHAHCNSHRICDSSCEMNAVILLREEAGKYIERELT